VGGNIETPRGMAADQLQGIESSAFASSMAFLKDGSAYQQRKLSW